MELTAEEAWTRILEIAREKLPEQGFRTWLARTAAIALSDDGLVVAVSSNFAVEWIEEKYADLLTGLARDLFGQAFCLNFESKANGDEIASLLPTPNVSQSEDSAAPDLTQGRTSGCSIRTRCRFATR